MLFLNCIRGFWILAVFIGCSEAYGPLVRNSSCGFHSTLPEDFSGTICRFLVIDLDEDDRITVIPSDNITSQLFNIVLDDSVNGVWVNITVKKPLDRETLGSKVTIRVAIIDNQHNQLNYDHVIYITDVNDSPPEFQNLSSYMLEINELPCNKTTIYTNIYATDKDVSENARITYSMTPKAQSPDLRTLYAQTFSMDPVTGHVSLSSCLDYERTPYYQFAVIAKDYGSQVSFTSTAELVILVKDVKDESAFIIG